MNIPLLKEWFSKRSKYFKNKYLVAFLLFFFYGMFLDDNDIFDIIKDQITLSKLKDEKELIDKKLNKTKFILKRLRYNSELEKYARENKLFKRDNEDIFIITYK
jgi:cell division protein DivIC